MTQEKKWFIFLAAFIAVFFSGMTILLMHEYRYFKNQAEELMQLKEDYQTYISAVKRMMLEVERSKDESRDTDSQKKKDLDSEDSFVLVNREKSYLRDVAVEFARCHNLERLVSQMYAIGESIEQPRQRRTRNRRIKKADSSYAQQEWQALSREPVFQWPIPRKNFWLSSQYGPRKKPDGTWGFHYGLDLAAVRGTLVYAAGTGIVIEARYAQGYGNTVLISHNNKFKTRYAHLDKILVNVGQKVGHTNVIGKVGDTGLVRRKGHDASHLHFEVYVFGKRLNPLYFMA